MSKMSILMICLIGFTVLLTACENVDNLPTEQEYHTGYKITLPEPELSMDSHQAPQVPGRIAILTEPFGWGGVGWEWFSANWLYEMHGGEMIVHDSRWGGSRGSMYVAAEEIINDPEIKVIIINSAPRGVNYFISKIREQRSDIFIVYIEYDSDNYCDYPYISLNFSESVGMADLILNIDMFGMYRNLPIQAQALGADTLAFFYIDGWDDNSDWAAHSYFYDERAIMREISEEIGLRFVEVARGPFCIQCGGSDYMYRRENVLPLIDSYGRDIVFVGLGGPRMLAMALLEGIIYLPSYMRSSPARLVWDMREYVRVPAAFVNASNEELSNKNHLEFIIYGLRYALDEHGMLGRVSTWPVSASTLLTYAAVEYGIKWMNGDVPQDGIDIELLQLIMTEFIAEYSGEYGLGVHLTQREREGIVYDNYVLVFMDFMTY